MPNSKLNLYLSATYTVAQKLSARLSVVSYANLYLGGHNFVILLRYLAFVSPFRKTFEIVISKINILLR